MTKKIAVVGCSFSAFWQGDATVETGSNYDVKTWSHHLVDNYDVTIDSFAQDGTGPGYLNYCLNYIYNAGLEYDLIIGNMPPLNRDWYFAYNKIDNVTDYENLTNINKWFEVTQEQERVKVYNISPIIVCHSHDKVINVQGSEVDILSGHEREYVKQHYLHIKNNYLLNHRKSLHYVQVAREYYGNILPFSFWYHDVNAFMDMEDTFESLIQHSISHEQPVKQFFEKEKDYKKYLVDHSHFSTYGHEHLLEKYILTDNKINSIII